jgi:hypothetical protein
MRIAVTPANPIPTATFVLLVELPELGMVLGMMLGVVLGVVPGVVPGVVLWLGTAVVLLCVLPLELLPVL